MTKSVPTWAATPASDGRDTALAAGAELHLTRCPLYVSSVAVSSAGTVTGTYYAWSAEVADGRVRITNRADRVGVSGQVTGWIDAAVAGVQTRPAADKPSGCTLTIGPVSAGRPGDPPQ